MRGAKVGWVVICALAALASPLSAQTPKVTAQHTGPVAQTPPPEPANIDPELYVEIGPNNSYLILENSALRVEYQPFTAGHYQFAIRSFYIKTDNAGEQICTSTNCYIDADAGRGALADAWIVQNDDARKTVRLEWFKEGDQSKRIIHEVSIYPFDCFIQVDYLNVQQGLNLVDLARPGGAMNATHVAWGGDSWIRDYVTLDYAPTVGSYYNRYPPDGVNDPADGGSLNYNGNFIVGVYNQANGEGYGRVAPIAATSILKLLLSPSERRGLELFPYPFYLSHPPFTGYIFGVTAGEDEIFAVGQMLADGQLP